MANGHLEVRNYSKFQTYKRTAGPPPWVKRELGEWYGASGASTLSSIRAFLHRQGRAA